MKDAFSYMFKDNKYIEKALVYAGVAFVANLFFNFSQVMNGTPIGLLLLLLGYLAMFIPSGYGISCIKALMIQNENYVLPNINIKNNFKLGFKIFVAGIILGLVIVGISIALFIIMGILCALLIPKDMSPMTGAIIFSIPIVLFMLAAFIAYLVYGLAMGNIFAQKEWYTTFLNFKFATKLISKEPCKYFSCLGLYLILFIIVMIITVVPSMIFTKLGTGGVIISSLISAVVSGYTIFVFSYITAKSVPIDVSDEQV